MRSLLVVVALAAIGAVVLLLGVVDRGGRAARDREEIAEQQAARASGLAARSESAAEAVSRDRARTGTPQPEPGRRLRLLYDDGQPAAGITVRCASGRKLVTRMFRNGDYPQKTIWMVTKQSSATTGENGEFTLGPAPGIVDAVLYTDVGSPAVLLAAWERGRLEYRAERRATVEGTLRGPDGKPRNHVWLSAQRGRPEDYDTRNHRESDSFVAAGGGLEIDPLFRFGTETDEDGRFTLRLAPGANTLSTGEDGEGGRMPIEVPATGMLDLGDISPPPAKAKRRSSEPRELHGTVRSLSGRPLPGAQVRLWDGNVGEASHEVRADEAGRWCVSGLRAHRVIAWALSSNRHHMVLPQQSSGTIHMPCSSPVALIAPHEDEYAWARIPDVNGFFLFVRDDVFLGGELLTKGDTIGLPRGRYHILAITDSGIRELSALLPAAKTLQLADFR